MVTEQPLPAEMATGSARAGFNAVLSHHKQTVLKNCLAGCDGPKEEEGEGEGGLCNGCLIKHKESRQSLLKKEIFQPGQQMM